MTVDRRHRVAVKMTSGQAPPVELLVVVSPFVLMAVFLLGLWIFISRRSGPVRPRWGITVALALAILVAGLVLGPDEMSPAERLLTFLPAAAFVLVVLPTIELLRRIIRPGS